MTMNAPNENWYMDTGATSHMTTSQGTLLPYFNMSKTKHIIVGSGHAIPIHGFRLALLPLPHRPLVLIDVLHAPKLTKNLISVRCFTTDNNVSIEFNPFGFSVKDIPTGIQLMRCESTGDLYPLPTSTTNLTILESTFAAISPTLWHNRLGHPRVSILHSLRNDNFIYYKQLSSSSVCQSCVFGKKVKLPFFDFLNCTYMPFDIIHSDLWPSSILSSASHKYYMLLLDDCSNFLWTFPIGKKSQVYTTLLTFSALI